MKKILLLIASTGIILSSTAQAWQEVDEANMSRPLFRVIKVYPGQWRGWSNAWNGGGNTQITCAPNYNTCGYPHRNQNHARTHSGYCECSCKK
jgi:hypothetical protein